MTASLALPPAKAVIAIAAGAAFAAAGWMWGPQDQRIAGALLAVALTWAAVVDVDRYVLPNLITLGLVATGLALAALESQQRLLDSAIGAAAGYLSLWAVASLFLRLRGKEGLGAGDWKLFAAAGAWLGWIHLPQVMLFASVAALVTFGGIALIRRKQPRPAYSAFGPFLAAGFWIVWVTGGQGWIG